MDCSMTSSVLSANYNTILFEFGVTLVSSKILYAVLRKCYQPRVLSDLLLGILLAQFRILSVTNAINLVFAKLGPFVFAPYLFALGVEMDPFKLLLDADAPVAYAGVLSTAGLVALLHSALALPGTGLLRERSLRAFLGLAAVLGNTASPVLTRLATDLKIAKTDVGRLAVGAGVVSDMGTTLLVALGSMVWRDGDADGVTSGHLLAQPLLTAAALAAVALSGLASRAMAEWVDGRNPEGRRMRGFDLSLVALAAGAMCWAVSALRLDFNMAAFMVGLAFPSQGRVSRLLVSKANFVLGSFVLPLYVAHVCLSLRQTTEDIEASGAGPEGFRAYVMQLPFPWRKVLLATAVGTAGKVAGSAAAGLLLKGLGWPEALALGLLLNVKGYFHVYCALAAFEAGIVTDRSFMALLFTVALHVAATPLVGMGLASWARRSVQWRLMGLQHHDPAAELRLVVGLRGAQDVAALAFVAESLRPGVGGALGCYAVDMVQLREEQTVVGGGLDGVTVVDEEVAEARRLIGEALEACVDRSVKVRRLLALSSFQDMHGDLCICAEDAMAALILLPFHKQQQQQQQDDAMGFRLVNQKVLQLAPCSVGIMVDRGLAKQTQNQQQTPVMVVFIGGADDREALTLAALACKHPGIRLTALRIVQSAAAQARARARTSLFESKSRRNILHLQNGGSAVGQEELQAQADDNFFAEFYRKHVAGNKGAVGYLEKHVADGAELVAVLRGMQGDYRLFVVGKGRDRSSVLTEGLHEWSECLELGPVGDILASSDFSATASVLIVQQYDAKKHYKVIDDDFMPL